MIGRVTGTIVHKEGNFAIVETHGIGYKIFSTREMLDAVSKTKEPSIFWTYTAVRDDAIDLYGFRDLEELKFFELLLSVSGIGPRSALSILNAVSVDNLRSAIASGDSAHLTKTANIGAKKAEKIVLELRDKFDMVDVGAGMHTQSTDAIDALQALGYSRREAQEALRRISPEIATTEQRITEALKVLGK